MTALPPSRPQRSTLRRVLELGCLLVMNLFLVSPVLFYELGWSGGRGHVDKIALFAVPASALWLLVAQLIRRPWIVHALLMPLYVGVAVDLYLIRHYQTRLTSSTITLILENWGNATDYLGTHGLQVGLGFGGVVLFHLVAVFSIRKLVLPPLPRMRVAAALALVFLYGAVIARQSRAQGGLEVGVLDVVSHDRNSPFGVFPQGYVAARIYREVLEHQQLAASYVFGASRSDAPEEPETYVLVVGESARRDHWGLYGYPRNTTPRLSREPNLVVFEDVVTQAALTQISVPLLLTRATIDDGNARLGEGSILTVFREIGFTTHWYSTQQRDQYTGAINRYSADAHEARFLDRQYDGALNSLVRAVLEKRDASAKQFFVLHTQGSHGPYEDRYPREFRIFPVAVGLPDQERLINSYDNSILYTDHVLAEVIELLREQPGIAAMIYVPDHAENLKDDERGLLGHFYNNEYDLPIPMAFWFSDRFAERYPEKVAAAQRVASQPVNTRGVFYSVADLGSATLGDPNHASLSVLSPAWRKMPRQVLQRWESITRRESGDYDEWVRTQPQSRLDSSATPRPAMFPARTGPGGATSPPGQR